MKNDTRINSAKWDEKNQRWRISIQRNGVRKNFTSTIKGNKGKAIVHKKADKWIKSNIVNDSINVGKFFDKYIENKKLFVSRSRIQSIKGIANKQILPILRYKKVNLLTEHDLQRVLNEMYMNEYSRSYMKEVKIVMLDILRFARQNKLTDLNCENLQISPKAKTPPPRKAFNLSGIKCILTNDTTFKNGIVQKDVYINFYRFCLLSGLRRGECMGLKWSDFLNDLQGNTILYLSRSINEYGEVTKGKTNNAERKIIVNDLMLNVLEQQKEIQKSLDITSEYVFTQKNGKIINGGTIQRNFSIYCNFHNLSRHKLHELRHTYITYLKNEIPLSTLKDITGHSESTKTLEIYGHTLLTELEKASKISNDIFTEILK